MSIFYDRAYGKDWYRCVQTMKNFEKNGRFFFLFFLNNFTSFNASLDTVVTLNCERYAFPRFIFCSKRETIRVPRRYQKNVIPEWRSLSDKIQRTLIGPSRFLLRVFLSLLYLQSSEISSIHLCGAFFLAQNRENGLRHLGYTAQRSTLSSHDPAQPSGLFLRCSFEEEITEARWKSSSLSENIFETLQIITLRALRKEGL